MPKDFFKDITLPQGFDKKLVEKAYKFADAAHKGQKRKSGDPYITHPLAVARILLDLKMGHNVITAALLHDVVEDTDISVEMVEKEFGSDVASLVQSVSNLRKVDFSMYSNPEEVERAVLDVRNENLRSLFMAMSEDVRVVIIKLADRLHNMQTLKALPKKDQQRIAFETLNIFSPLALRLGMGEIKGSLEDLAFPIAYPTEYKKLKKEANRRYKAADRYVLKVKRTINDELKKAKVEAKVEGRAKHIYSLYKKITRADIDWDFDKVYDLVAIRIITSSVEDCYKVLGTIHSTFRPLPDKIKDYIAAPKPNGYRSIHTTVFGPEGKIVEIQIRTEEIHEEAEYGVASHLHYTEEKSKGKSSAELDEGRVFASEKQTKFLRQIKEWQDSVESYDEYLEGLKLEFLDDRIYVFSPQGDIFDLPVGATPVDFAYDVHSDIGDRCTGAKVNGKIVPLDTKLQTRDVVEIITVKNGTPKRAWLDFVKTSKAKQHIRGYLRKFNYEKNAEEGKAVVEEELEILGYSLDTLSETEIFNSLTDESSFKKVEDLYAAVGEGLVTRRQAVKIILGKPFIPEPIKKVTKRPRKAQKADLGGLKVNIAPCCKPDKNSEVICYVTRNKGLTVHRKDCSNLESLEEERLYYYNPWRDEIKDIEKIEVLAENRVGLIRDISNVIASYGVNIEKITNEHKKGSSLSRVVLALSMVELAELSDLLHALKDIPDVSGAKRIK
ncbi:MAG: bifunctional (p)ppGpp synthetase/guanosine-3',5'-bis(diphosphate) 3'-pyrophosphohydrolase [Patescibacteria group bacterium]|nr:bifunctional (p)ppGpp synthetase/guanosine-3',5'-bis(diphosphate) 3'-pyrophosphohydrolase [Patescibacteria group bacterium]